MLKNPRQKRRLTGASQLTDFKRKARGGAPLEIGAETAGVKAQQWRALTFRIANDEPNGAANSHRQPMTDVSTHRLAGDTRLFTLSRAKRDNLPLAKDHCGIYREGAPADLLYRARLLMSVEQIDQNG